MKLVLLGFASVLVGFGILFAMVVRVVEPGLGLSLIGFVAMFGGTMAAVVGTVALVRRTGR
jgi:hypothetical protein